MKEATGEEARDTKRRGGWEGERGGTVGQTDLGGGTHGVLTP